MLNTEPSPVVRANWLLAESYVKLSTPATEAVFAKVIRPSAATVKTGICVEEPYVLGVTPVFAIENTVPFKSNQAPAE